MSYADTKSHATATVKGETKEIIMMTTEQYEREHEDKDATIAALREEAALYQKEWAILRAEVERLKVKLERWKIPHTIEELTEMKEQSNQPSLAAKQAYINALEWHFSESRARAEQAEREHEDKDATIAALREENQSLLDCLNGSSKAVYTAEMYDALRAEVERLSKDRKEVLSYLQAVSNCALQHPEGYTLIDFQQVWGSNPHIGSMDIKGLRSHP